MADLLNRIDAAVDGLCACGCGQPLDPSGPSGWWASETCQARWQGRRVRPGGAQPGVDDDAVCEPGSDCTCWVWSNGPSLPERLAVGDRLRLSMPDGESTDLEVTDVAADGTLTTSLVQADRTDREHDQPRRSRLQGWLQVQSDRLHDLPANLLRRVFPLAYCPGHRRRECAMCAWPDPQVLVAVHRGERVDRPGDAIRRLGQAIQQAAGVLAGFGETFRQAVAAGVQAEQDRVTLRALCADDAEYERALRAARDHGLTVREVAEMLAAGSFLVDGRWFESHVCAWDYVQLGRYRCGLRWTDGTRCDSTTADPSAVRRTERLVGPSATGGGAS